MASAGNRLEIGQSRIGLMIDGLPDTPRVAVKLERTAKGVEVTIPFLDGHTDPYQYWFSGGIMYGDDPAKTKRRYEPPVSISFYDASGSVGLIGSRVQGSRITFGGTSTGEGRLAFDYAVLGASSGAAYEAINGLRSEVEGLGTWIGLRALNAQHEVEDGRLIGVRLHLQSSPPIRAGRRLNAEFESNWRYGPGPGPDQTTITERMQIRTQVKRSASWQDHFNVHSRVRDLLRVAAWRRLNFVGHEAMSTADPLRTVDGTAHGNQWLSVLTSGTGIREAATKVKWSDFLFSYADVGSRGVGRWLDLSRKLERGLTPLIGLLDLEGATLEAHLAQVGIGFEMLGYDLVAEGQSKTKAKSAGFMDLVRAVSSVVSDVLPFSPEDFPGLLRRTYVGVKHADNAAPDWREVHLAYLQSIQVLRAWVALQLGVPKPRLRTAMERDPVTRRVHEIALALGQDPSGAGVDAESTEAG